MKCGPVAQALWKAQILCLPITRYLVECCLDIFEVCRVDWVYSSIKLVSPAKMHILNKVYWLDSTLHTPSRAHILTPTSQAHSQESISYSSIAVNNSEMKGSSQRPWQHGKGIKLWLYISALLKQHDRVMELIECFKMICSSNVRVNALLYI